MKIWELEKKLILKFTYREIEFSMVVDIISKEKDYIIITAILENEITLDPDTMIDIKVLYVVKDGIYTFNTCHLQSTEFNNMRAYAVFCDEDVEKVNRREDYRVFIGEIAKITITPITGPKIGMEGIIKNISANGMAVILKREIKVGSKMSILYNFEGLNIHLLGEVIRADKAPGRNYYVYGCKLYSPNSLVNRVVMLKQMRAIKRSVQEPEE